MNPLDQLQTSLAHELLLYELINILAETSDNPDEFITELFTRATHRGRHFEAFQKNTAGFADGTIQKLVSMAAVASERAHH